MSEDLTLAELHTISASSPAILILNLLNRVEEPLSIPQMEKITGLSYGTIDSIVFRLIRTGVIQETRNRFDTRSTFYEIKAENLVQQILQHHEKQKEKDKQFSPSKGRAEEV